MNIGSGPQAGKSQAMGREVVKKEGKPTGPVFLDCNFSLLSGNTSPNQNQGVLKGKKI